MNPIPWQIREAVRGLLSYPARRRARASFATMRRASGTAPSVGFGGVLEEGPVHGGAVKLLPLRDAFGGGPETNILYVVSSKLPRFAGDLIARCREVGILVVWNQNGVGYPAWAGQESEKYNRPMRSLRASADFVIYQSEFCRLSAERFLGPCASPSEILLNPVDLDKFRPAAEDRPARPLRLLTLGTHGYRERVLSTIDCLALLREGGIEATLTIAGRFLWTNGRADVQAHAAARKVAPAVEILPPFSQDEAARLYRSHHIVLHPKYMDPCPTVAIEALASGCPVVGSRSGGMPELVAPECGVLIDAPCDWDRMTTPTGSQMAAAVSSLLPSLEAAARAARLQAERRFDVKPWVESHGRIFETVLK